MMILNSGALDCIMLCLLTVLLCHTYIVTYNYCLEWTAISRIRLVFSTGPRLTPRSCTVVHMKYKCMQLVLSKSYNASLIQC